jgi:4-amino-4-deoxy-L-arabinose transferase-like glycosyltransferase
MRHAQAPPAARHWFANPNLQVGVLFALALALRMVGISSRPLNFDEQANVSVAGEVLRIREIAPLQDLSEGPIVALSTPLMGYEHPLGAVYLTRLGTAIFGWSPFGVRIVHVVLGAVAVFLVYRLTTRAFGPAAGILAMFLMAIEPFHIGWSRTVQPQSAMLCMVALSLLLFCKTVQSGDGKLMLLTGAATGFAYLAKEESSLLLPIFAAFLVLSPLNRVWFRRRELYLALLLMAGIASVDLFRLLQEKAEPDMNLAYYWMGLASGHVSLAAVKFYLGDLVMRHAELFVRLNPDFAMQADYADLVMHWVMGMLCLAGVGYAVRDWKHDAVKLLLIAFVVVCGFFTFGFTLSELANPYWHASISFIPAVILAARLLADVTRRWPRFGTVAVVSLLVYLTFKTASFFA